MKTNEKHLLEDFGPGTIIEAKWLGKYNQYQSFMIIKRLPGNSDYRSALILTSKGELTNTSWNKGSNMNLLSEDDYAIIVGIVDPSKVDY